MARRTFAYRALSSVASAVAAVIVVLDMALGPVLRPIAQAIAKSRVTSLLRAFSRRLPAYVALAFLAVPLAVAEPAKIFALYLIGDGHYVSGVLLLVAAYLISLMLVDTIYDGARPQLRSIAWFATIVDWISAIRIAVMSRIRALRAYRVAREQVLRVRSWFGRRLAKASGRP